MQDERTVVVHSAAELVGLPTRRGFLKALAAGGSLVLMPSVFTACNDDNSITSPPTTSSPQTISLASDVGVFTFAYVLEQLESSFYEQVTTKLPSFATIFSTAEQELLLDIRNDEVTHREFLRAVLGTSFPGNLQFNFGTVATDRVSLLTTALTLETNGIAAYNGAGKALKNANNLLMAGKIVSVEARHTSAIADALDTKGTAYADLTAAVLSGLGADPTNALDAAADPNVVLKNAQPFIASQITLTA